MKLDFKLSTVLTVVGILLAAAFFLTALISPKSLDWILHSEDEVSERIKKEMERQKEIDAGGRADAQPGRKEDPTATGATPTPSPQATIAEREAEARRDDSTPRTDCISRDRIVQVIGASEEARDGRVVAIGVARDGGRIMIDYRKKTILGIGSGENQIESILQRGLRRDFPETLIKSLKVRSEGTEPSGKASGT